MLGKRFLFVVALIVAPLVFGADQSSAQFWHPHGSAQTVGGTPVYIEPGSGTDTASTTLAYIYESFHAAGVDVNSSLVRSANSNEIGIAVMDVDFVDTWTYDGPVNGQGNPLAMQSVVCTGTASVCIEYGRAWNNPPTDEGATAAITGAVAVSASAQSAAQQAITVQSNSPINKFEQDSKTYTISVTTDTTNAHLHTVASGLLIFSQWAYAQFMVNTNTY